MDNIFRPAAGQEVLGNVGTLFNILEAMNLKIEDREFSDTKKLLNGKGEVILKTGTDQPRTHQVKKYHLYISHKDYPNVNIFTVYAHNQNDMTDFTN